MQSQARNLALNMTSVLLTTTHREYFHVGSATASMLSTVAISNTKFMSLELEQQDCVKATFLTLLFPLSNIYV